MTSAVGAGSPNLRDDVESEQRLLNLCHESKAVLPAGPLIPDGAFGAKTLNGIMAFQRDRLGETAPSGKVEPRGVSLRRLCDTLPETLNAQLLGLLYLRAGNPDLVELAPVMVKVMAERKIDNPLRQAHFLAQVGHESGELRFREEIASGAAYEGRSDLGNTVPGDGVRFKGRGLIQLTGRANYASYGRSLQREAELLENPGLVASDAGLCVDVAGWYWAKRDLNPLADSDDLNAITRKVNGGLNGLEDRRRLLVRAKSLLGA